MNVKGKDLPAIALAYRNHMARTHGGNTEVCVTAFAHYAQIVEGLLCDDDLYKADGLSVKWFEENKTP